MLWFFSYDNFAVISASYLHVFGSKQTKHRKHVRVQSGKARCHSCQESHELGELEDFFSFFANTFFSLRDMQPKIGFASVPSSCRLLPSKKVENWAPPKDPTAREAKRLFSRFVFSAPFWFFRDSSRGLFAHIWRRGHVIATKFQPGAEISNEKNDLV